MPKFINYFTNPLIKLLGGVLRDEQVVIQTSRVDSELTDEAPASFAKAVVARLYLAFRNMTSKRNYDLEIPDDKIETIKNAVRIETYLRRSRDRYVELIWKNKYEFIGQNKLTVSYVKRRFKEIAQITETPTAELLEQISEELILYYNCFVIKIRKANASSGKPRKYFNKIVQPVAGYFVADVTKMRARLDKKTNQILGWEYNDPKRDPWKPIPFYNFRDVIHFKMCKPAGKIFGEPAAIPVLNDIRALRRMEENVEILVFQHSIPLYHYTVGTEEKPAKPGEVDAIKLEVENMVTQGMLITNERHKIVVVGAEREALKVDNYLLYFKTRVLTGLGQSTVSLGESGGVSRATASILTKAVVDSAIRFQTKIQSYVNTFMIDELLSEGGFNTYDDKVKVELFIPEIDLDDKLRKEFHTLSLWQGNLITEDEARKELGRDPFAISDRKKTYYELVTKPTALIQAVDEPYLETHGTAAQKKILSKKAIANKAAPKNQNGTKRIEPTQRTGGDSGVVELRDSMSISGLEDIYKEYFKIFTSQYYAVQEDIYSMIEENSFNSGKISINLSKQIVIEKGSLFIVEAYKKGIESVGYNESLPYEADLKMLHNYHVKSITKFFDDLQSMIEKAEKDKEVVMNIFDSQFYRIKFIIDWFVRKSYWLSIASGLRSKGVDKLKVIKVNENPSDICNQHDVIVDLTSPLYVHKIPPYHSFCKCGLEFGVNNAAK